MSEMKLTRLNKVLREFNISLDRAVEFLASNDHTIEARPTTKISEVQYNLFLNEFSSDKSNKVESHDLSEEKRKEKEELRVKLEQEQEEKIKKQNALIKAKVEVKKPIYLGKIDLDKLNKPKSSKVQKNIQVDQSVKDDKTNDIIERTLWKDTKRFNNSMTEINFFIVERNQYPKSKPDSGLNSLRVQLTDLTKYSRCYLN